VSEQAQDLSKYVCEKVRNMLIWAGLNPAARPGFYVSDVMTCPFAWGGCGATVRMLGVLDHKDGWHCPVCACGWPYVFWNFKATKEADPNHQGGVRSVVKIPELAELVLWIAADACQVCGERQTCYCERKKKAEADKAKREAFEKRFEKGPGHDQA